LLTALCFVFFSHQVGTSGAGKSTLLDCVAFRKTLKKGSAQSGEVRINGNPVSKKEMAYTAGYCEQDDTHVPQSTVRESVRFAAMLRLPASLSENEKNRKVTKALERLGLLPFSDVVVKALGASEKKLLTMALELVAEPTILFLDEPTSGLSLTSSLKVVNAMRAVRDSGTGVICTIHQPSQEIFQSFDRLLLLQRGGKTVYYGEISDLSRYFVERGQQPVAPDANVADWMLDCVADESRDWHQEWNDSDLRRRLDEEVVALSAPDEGGRESLSAPNRVSFFVQARECIKRQLTTYYRMPEYNFTRVLLQTLVGVIVGLLYLREIDDTQQGARLLAAAAFLSVIPCVLLIVSLLRSASRVGGAAVLYPQELTNVAVLTLLRTQI
jgi:ABC-type multidrug transport system ATPase subunit